MKNLVLQGKGDYTLIARTREDFTVHEYVVAWCYNKDSDSWGQGHYFYDFSEAINVFEGKTATMYEKRMNLLMEMHKYLRDEVEDEEAYDSWIHIVPDKPCKEDFRDLACDEDLWKHCAKKFGRLVKLYEQVLLPH